MKKTALYNKHVELGAKMVPFAGFDMPVQYSGVTEEHFAVREKAGPKYADCRKSPVFLPSKRKRRNSG